MRIPQDLQQPGENTLLVVANTQTALIYANDGENIVLAKKIFFEKERASDKEGCAMRSARGPSGGRQIQGLDNVAPIADDDHLLIDHLCKTLDNELFTRFKNKEFEKWYLVAPDYIIKIVKNQMHPYLKKSLSKTLPQNLVRRGALEILKKIREK
ncbi:MAG: host attachment protein [Patescibacteria group bacterium]|nr:host attachment protein [Patescibacteria group bacterium]